MFPTPLPAAVAADAGREAELKVYDALGAALGPDHCVFYGVAWLSKSPGAAARDGEVDFVAPGHSTVLRQHRPRGRLPRLGQSAAAAGPRRRARVHLVIVATEATMESLPAQPGAGNLRVPRTGAAQGMGINGLPEVVYDWEDA